MALSSGALTLWCRRESPVGNASKLVWASMLSERRMNPAMHLPASIESVPVSTCETERGLSRTEDFWIIVAIRSADETVHQRQWSRIGAASQPIRKGAGGR